MLRKLRLGHKNDCRVFNFAEIQYLFAASKIYDFWTVAVS